MLHPTQMFADGEQHHLFFLFYTQGSASHFMKDQNLRRPVANMLNRALTWTYLRWGSKSGTHPQVTIHKCRASHFDPSKRSHCSWVRTRSWRLPALWHHMSAQRVLPIEAWQVQTGATAETKNCRDFCLRRPVPAKNCRRKKVEAPWWCTLPIIYQI